jgi:hypothetical protein
LGQDREETSIKAAWARAGEDGGDVQAGHRRPRAVKRHAKAFKLAGRVATILGLVAFYGTCLSAISLHPPGLLLKVGTATGAAGCLWLACVLPWLSTSSESATLEAALAFLCLPPGLFSVFAASYNEMGRLYASWLIIGIIAILAAVGLVLQAARTRQRAERWRNSGRDDG